MHKLMQFCPLQVGSEIACLSLYPNATKSKFYHLSHMQLQFTFTYD